ncbi:hypothetical protein EVAR_69384_1 [Eumeta japonica]|uniref:Uncharacterized protein n=1 Tax=Eumeta variegata TaxID=151549 RepID=A0A4C1SNI8_EUMVA|nr:hypothetical protein EVAR_69384_1 [Eumeta japonica]
MPQLRRILRQKFSGEKRACERCEAPKSRRSSPPSPWTLATPKGVTSALLTSWPNRLSYEGNGLTEGESGGGGGVGQRNSHSLDELQHQKLLHPYPVRVIVCRR